MNQGKIWLVVKPTIGLPLFLGGVATISLCVHSAILNHTEWMPAFFNGNKKAKVAEVTVPAAKVSANVATGADGKLVLMASAEPTKAPTGKQ